LTRLFFRRKFVIRREKISLKVCKTRFHPRSSHSAIPARDENKKYQYKEAYHASLPEVSCELCGKFPVLSPGCSLVAECPGDIS
ncbi:MAG: hypothetical protein ACKV2V_21140, partial [Blastocatellia bacterium]